MSIMLPTLDFLHARLVKLEASRPLSDGLPAYLFRGEQADYPSTCSTLDRHCRALGLMSQEYDELNDVADYAQNVALMGWQLEPRIAAAFCQHYGLPTQMFDFTASANVAVSFSANRQSRPRKERNGRIAVLDVQMARTGGCAVDDLRHFEQAKRPALQHGFGVMLARFEEDDIVDLKNEAVAESIGLQWLEFAHLPDDETFLHVIDADSDLCSLQTDEAARLPQDLVDQYVSNRSGLCEKAARILSDEIPPVDRNKEENYRRWSAR